jgi:Xaa-Pro aminopeptidase
LSIAQRLSVLRETLRERGLDAFLVSSPENRRYLSGFTGTAGYLLVSPEQAVLATDFRYVEQAGRQAPRYRVERVTGKLDWFPKVAAELGVKRIGFESQHLTFGAHTSFQKAIRDADRSDGLALVETSDTLDLLRASKYAEELRLLARAVKITDEAFVEVGSTVQVGVTEREVAWRLEKGLRERGAEAVAFDIIVGAGPNGALPHHLAGDTVIGVGEPVVIDMGARYQGYCADLTRTIVIGEPDETFRRVYGTVLRAQLAAEEGVEPGMTGGEVDAISRDVIEEAGYGKSFGHSLGHGVGLAVHELPHVGPNASDILANGMIFTIEPGIYLPDWGGVRIEDVVVLEKGRARVMSKAPKLEYDQ